MIALRCPYCGAELDFTLEYTAVGYYSEHRDLTGIECGDYECDAKWDRSGNPTTPSKKGEPL